MSLFSAGKKSEESISIDLVSIQGPIYTINNYWPIYLNCLSIPDLVSKCLILEGPEPLYYVRLSVSLCVRLSVCLTDCHTCGQRDPRSGRETKTMFSPTCSVRFQFSFSVWSIGQSEMDALRQ